MSFVQAGDQRLEYFDRGDGPVVVLIHGAGSSARIWDAVQGLLADAGFRSIAISLPGAGGSDRAADLDGYQPSAYGANIKNALTALGITRCSLVGHSLGVSNVLYFMTGQADGVDVDAMVMIAGGSGDRRDAPLRAEQEELIRKMLAAAPQGESTRAHWEPLHRGLSPQAREALWNDIAANPPERAAGQRVSARADMTPFLSGTDIPTLVMTGDRDSVVPVAATLAMYAKLPAEVAHLSVLFDIDHYPNAEAPDAVAGVLAAFLQRYSKQSGPA